MHSVLKFHVYLIRSESDPSRYYKGYTTNLEKRIVKHNQGEVLSTAKHRPWILQTSISFDSKEKALELERYLKTHSGRAFSSKHL